jgi:hypothetical protein
MSLFPAVTPVFLERIIALLVPLFLTSAGGDAEAAGHAARCMIASYDVETEEEIRLAAEIASFGFGALDALSSSMDPDLSPRAVLRLRGSANAQHRSARTSSTQPASPVQPAEHDQAQPAKHDQPAEQDQPAKHDQADPAKLAQPAKEGLLVTVSRQQRRAMQRALEKAQRQQAEHARREAMRIRRAEAAPSAATVPIPRPAPQHSLAV